MCRHSFMQQNGGVAGHGILGGGGARRGFYKLGEEGAHVQPKTARLQRAMGDAPEIRQGCGCAARRPRGRAVAWERNGHGSEPGPDSAALASASRVSACGGPAADP